MSFPTSLRFRLHSLVLPLVLAAVASLPAGAADAPATPRPERIFEDVLGRVVEVRDATTVVVNRGSAEGLSRETTSVAIYPLRVDQKGERSLGYPVRLARARVKSLTAHSAVLTLSVVTSPVQVGDAVGYTLGITEAQRDDPLFEVALRDVGLRTLDEEEPLYGLAELLADPSEASRTRILEALVAEVHARAEMAASVYTTRIEGGRFHGKTLQEAFTTTGPSDVLAFLDFVRAFPGKYSCTTWKLVDVYGTWIISGTGTGDWLSSQRRAKPLLDEGDKAAEEARFADAEDAYRRALALSPDDKTLRERLESMINVRVWSALLEKDPDDTETRWKRMRVYSQRDVYEATARELDLLEAAGYRPEQVTRYRGFLACKQERYDEARRIFKRLLARGPDAELSYWDISCAQLKQLKARPGSARALLVRAEQEAARGNWDSAQSRYLDALDAAKTKAEIDQARVGQRRVALLSEIDNVEEWAREGIEEHDLPQARKRVGQLLALCDQARKPGLAEERLKRLAEAAYNVDEEELAIELRRELLRRAPRDVSAHQSLAWVLYIRGELEAATAVLDAAQVLDPNDDTLHQTRARVLMAQGRLKEARASAERALADKTYAWPRVFLAQLSAAEGRHEEASRWAKEAYALDPDETDMRTALLATVQAEEAARAIAEGRDVARNRLRLVRALAAMELGEAAWREASALKDTPHSEEASWAIASIGTDLVRLPLKAAAAAEVRTQTPFRARVLALVRARLALRERPEDGPARVALARVLVENGSFNRALAVLGSLWVEGKDKELSALDVAELARRGLRALEAQEVARQAALREDYKTADSYVAQAHEQLEAVGAREFAFLMAGWRATVLSNQGRHAEALRFLAPIIEAARADGDALSLQALERRAAGIESKNGSLDSIHQALTRGRTVCETLDDESCLAEIHKGLGQLEAEAGRLAAARQELEHALRLAQRSGQEWLVRETLGELSDVARRMFEPKRSRELAEDLLLRSRKALDSHNERFALMVLGALAMNQGDAAAARARFEEVYRLGQRTGDTWTRAQARLWDGNAALLAARDSRAALASYQQAVMLYGAAGDAVNQAHALSGEGEARAALGELDQAREALTSVIELARTHKRSVMEGHAQAELALLEVQRGQPQAALAAAGEAVRLADAFDIPEERWLAHYALARALEVGGKQAEAPPHYETAVAELGRVMGSASGDADRERMFSYGRRRQVFQDAIDLYLRLGKTERALELLQLSHDTRLRQMFDPTRLKAQDGQLQQTLQQLGEAESKTQAAHRLLSEEQSKPPEQRSEARIQALTKVVASNQGEMRQLLLRLKHEHRQLYALLAINPDSIADLRQSLPRDTLVVEYFVATDALYAFLITRDQARAQAVKVSVSAREVEEAVDAYLTALVQESEDVSKWAERLHGWLIAPIEAEMARAKTTLVVPFGPLYSLPFHALSAPDASGRPVYVLEKHRLGYLSSTTVFKMVRRQHSQARTLLGFANPDGSLPGARAELERIASESFRSARVLYGQDATRERFFELAGGYDIVHFATHGVLHKNPLDSHLKMAREPLTVYEITGFQGLMGKTDLVVLSACATAREEGEGFGEPGSLATAFTTAGAPATVASLWQVDDEATSELMAAFYAQLRKGPKVDTLEALRQAQLHLLRKEEDGKRPFQHPGLWGAFELIGDFR